MSSRSWFLCLKHIIVKVSCSLSMETSGYLTTLLDTTQLRFMKYYRCVLSLPPRTGTDPDHDSAGVNVTFAKTELEQEWTVGLRKANKYTQLSFIRQSLKECAGPRHCRVHLTLDHWVSKCSDRYLSYRRYQCFPQPWFFKKNITDMHNYTLGILLIFW